MHTARRSGRARRRLRRTAAVVIVATTVCGASDSRAQVTVPASRTPQNAEVIAGYGGHVTWVDTVAAADGRNVKVVLDRIGTTTRVLPIAAMNSLDVGPGPEGQAVAVYDRCQPRCRLWRFDYATNRETRIRPSVGGLRFPTVWGHQLALLRGGTVYVAAADGKRARPVARIDDADTIELGPGVLAFTLFDAGGEGNGTMTLGIYGLRSRRLDVVRERTAGESTSAVFVNLAFARTRLLWSEVTRNGCSVGPPAFKAYMLRRQTVRSLARSAAPLFLRGAARSAPPPVPASDDCP
jgi:hypothetical protein